VRRGQKCHAATHPGKRPNENAVPLSSATGRTIPTAPRSLSILAATSTQSASRWLFETKVGAEVSPTRLFHHFQTTTLPTLLLTPETWPHMIQLSLAFDFLTDTILCIAARHLSTLRPEHAAYGTAASHHLHRAVSRFRYELLHNSGTLTSTHLDAFISTSTLLQYEIWAGDEGDGGRDVDPTKDRVFAFNSALKGVFLRGVSRAQPPRSALLPHMAVDVMGPLIEAARADAGRMGRYLELFPYCRPLSLDMVDAVVSPCVASNNTLSTKKLVVDPHGAAVVNDGYTNAVEKLSLLLSFLPDPQGPAEETGSTAFSSPLSWNHFARYISAFPVMCHGPFAAMVERGDPHAMLLLHHYYRAVRVLLPPRECWWTCRRAATSEAALKTWLTRYVATSIGS
jgi:hypothetical protein